jgi:uncharacterized protein (DUF1499 family)
MKIIWFASVFVVIVLAVAFIAGQLGLLKGPMPKDLGVRDGRLKPPAKTPNSVSSQADLYPEHRQKDYASIKPIEFTGDGVSAMAKLAGILKGMERTEVITIEPDYIYAQCGTQLLKFTDDIEFWLDRAAGVIQVRSASRLGKKDFNVNRERVEKIRAEFGQNSAQLLP